MRKSIITTFIFTVLFVSRGLGDTYFYGYEVIARTGVPVGSGTPVAIGRRPSINDSGKIAFIARDDGSLRGRVMLIGEGTVERDVTIGSPATVSDFVQVNNADQIIYRQGFEDGLVSHIVRLDTTTGGVIIGSGSLTVHYTAPFDVVLDWPTLNNNGRGVFSADIGIYTVLASRAGGSGPHNVSGGLTGYPNLYPMVSDDSRTVVRWGGSSTSPLVYITSEQLDMAVLITESPEYTAIGEKPGISDDGRVLVYAAEHSTLGRGIFMAIIAEPGITYIAKVANLIVGSDLNYRVGVNRISSDSNTDYTVVYVAKSVLNGSKGLYSRRVDISDPAFLVLYPEQLVAEVGRTIGNFVITVQDIDIYDPVNNRGQIAFWIRTTAGTEAVIKAAPALVAKNLWDGKRIKLQWPEGLGTVQVIRRNEDHSNEVTFNPTDANSYIDDTVEVGKVYRYHLQASHSKRMISNEAIVKAEVIVVLVRGYSPMGTGVNPDYWKPDPKIPGLEDVNNWFTQRGLTCWDPHQQLPPLLSGIKTIDENVAQLHQYIKDKLKSPVYLNNSPTRINLIGHSMGGLISRRYAAGSQSNVKVDKIFCIQTPHTGSPLADIFPALPGNEAHNNLKPSFLKSFNNQYSNLHGTRLYSFWSDEIWETSHNLGLVGTAGLIVGELKDNLRFFPGTNDGAVPVLSAKGQIRNWYGGPVYQKVVMSGFHDSNLDHLSCYKDSNTLEKILEWMGLSVSQTSSMEAAPITPLDAEEEPGVVPLYFVGGFSGQFDSNTPVSETALISDSEKAYFRAITSDASCSFTLNDPCGIIYDPCYASSEANVSYEAEYEVFIYEVNSPVPGTWTLNLSTTVAPPNLVDYGLTVFEDANIALFSYANPDWANKDANVLILATLTEDNSPVTDANLMADITLPDTNMVSLILYDDGLHNDTNADDGIYTGTFTTTSQVGTYNIRVTATGTLVGTDFERRSPLSFTISAPDVHFAGDINDVGMDLNENGFYDILSLTIPVDVNAPNQYLLTAALYDSNDSLIILLSSGKVNLPTGPNTLTLEVSSEDIVKHNVDGPYKLSDITLSDANTGLVIAIHADYNISSYVVSDFEPLDTDGDGLSDNFELSIGTDRNLSDSDSDGLSDYDEVGYDSNSSTYNPATDLNPLNTDTDADGMSDSWEDYWGFDPIADDGAKDNDDDRDGLTNLREYQNNTKPKNADSDMDGMPDGWEVDYWLDPLAFDSLGDHDSDGLLNFYEYQNETDPNDNDTDNDSILDGPDNCKLMYNPSQVDADADGEGDTCEVDISENNEVDLVDFALLSLHWPERSCGDCGGADFDGNGDVDWRDVGILADNWLAGAE